MINAIILIINCLIWYNIGKSQGHKECEKLFEEIHREKCLRCESEK